MVRKSKLIHQFLRLNENQCFIKVISAAPDHPGSSFLTFLVISLLRIPDSFES